MSEPPNSPPFAIGDVFGREALSKPATRAKLWLLAAAPAASFRAGLMQLLGLPPGARIELRRFAGPARPPDLAVIDGDRAIAILDHGRGGMPSDRDRAASEAGGLGASRHGLPLYIIATRRRETRGTTWAAVRNLARESLPAADAQEAVTLNLLIGAIDAIRDAAATAPRPGPRISAEAAQNPWIKEACAPLLDLRMGPYVVAEGFAVGSASIRLIGPKHCVRQDPRRKGVVLAMARATQEDQAFVAGTELLREHLAPHLEPWIVAWDEMLRSAASGALSYRRMMRVSTAPEGLPAAAVAALFGQLVTLLLARRPR